MSFFQEITRTGSKVLICILCVLPVITYANNNAQIMRQLVDVRAIIAGYAAKLSQPLTTVERARVQQELTTVALILEEIASQIVVEDDDVRKNVQVIYITGDVRSLTAKAVVVYGSEVVAGVRLPPTTTTVNIPTATSNFGMSRLEERMADLITHAKNYISNQTGLTQTTINENAQISIRQFRNASDVRALLDVVKPNEFPIHIGTYSVVNEVVVVGGNQEFRLHLRSDQKEEATLIVMPHSRNCFIGPMCSLPNQYDYGFEYRVNNVRVYSESNVRFSREDIVRTIRDFFDGVGVAFTPPVSDSIVINELVDFAITAPTYYTVSSAISHENSRHLVEAERCHSASIKKVLQTIAGHYLDSFQLSAPLSEIMIVRAPVVYETYDYIFDNNIYSQCIGDSSMFFPSLQNR